MTEEQIKQNAEKYAKKIYPYTAGKAAAIRDFIAGAHSRDEEIAAKDRALALFTKKANVKFEYIINKIENPWISVDDRLPEEHSRVLIMFCNGTVTYNDYIGVGDINYMKAHPEIITHWMPIPKIEKGEKQ